NLGLALLSANRLEESISRYRHVLELRPDHPEAYYNMAFALAYENKPHEALDCYRRAIELRGDYAQAHFNQAVTLLSMGRFVEAWPQYEWRFRQKGNELAPLAQPRWRGEPLDGKTILLRSEQGLGDAIQFVRYARLVHERRGRV